MFIHQVNTQPSILPCFWECARWLCWRALTLLVGGFHIQVKCRCLRGWKATCLSGKTVPPAANFNPDYNSWGTERSFISEWPSFGNWSLLIGQPAFLTFPSRGSAAAVPSMALPALSDAVPSGPELSRRWMWLWLTEQQVGWTAALASSKRQRTRWKHPAGWALPVDCQLDLLS